MDHQPSTMSLRISLNTEIRACVMIQLRTEQEFQKPGKISLAEAIVSLYESCYENIDTGDQRYVLDPIAIKFLATCPFILYDEPLTRVYLLPDHSTIEHLTSSSCRCDYALASEKWQTPEEIY